MTTSADYRELLPSFDVFDPEHSKLKWDVLSYVPFSSSILARVVFNETDADRIAVGVSIINRIAHDQCGHPRHRTNTLRLPRLQPLQFIEQCGDDLRGDWRA